MKFILSSLIFLLTIFSFNVYAKDDFNVILKCKDELESSCNVYKILNNKKTVILEDMRAPQVKKLNNDFYQVYGSCGNPCQYNLFIGRNKDDATKEFIAIDKNNNCLIESDSKSKKIYARNLLSNKRKLIENLKDKEFNQLSLDFSVYNIFQGDSYFSKEGELYLVAMLDDVDSNGNIQYFKKKINKPCE